MKLDCTYHLLSVILFFFEILDVIGDGIDFFFRASLDFILVLLFFEDSIDIYFNFVVVFLPFLFGESAGPVQMHFGDYDVMQFVVIVIILEEFFALFEIFDFYFISELTL